MTIFKIYDKVFVVSKTKPYLERGIMEIDSDPAVAHILAKLSATPVVEGFEPVVIVQHGGKLKTGMQRAFSYVAGSGTMVNSGRGMHCVMTAEHIFSRGRKQNHTHPCYGIRVLREDSEFLSRHLVAANPFFRGAPGIVDIAACMVSTTWTEAIEPFSNYQPGGGEVEKRTTNFNICVGPEDKRTIKSLVSGEGARLLAMVKIPGTKLHYYVVDYQSISGESGTGFVGSDKSLYVLKGSVVEGVEDFNLKFKQLGVIQEDCQDYSIVAGGLSINAR